MEMCKKLDKGAIPRAARGADHLLTIVVYRKGEEESLNAPEPGDLLVHPGVMENRQITITNTQCGCASKPTDVRIEGGLIKVELSGELTNKLGKGIYRLDLTYDELNSHYADGKRHIALSKEVCNVVDPKDATEPMAAEIRLEVQAMLKGDKGDSAFEWAVKQGLCSTQEQFVEVFRGATGLSAYELYLASTRDSPKKTLEEWLDSIGGKDGKSVYDLALDDGFVGDLHAFLLSIHGRDGKDAYQHYLDTTADNPKKSVEDWLASNKGEKGDSAYQSYLRTTNDTTKLTEKQWANANDFFYQLLFRILQGAGVKPTEKDMTADQVLELERWRVEMAKALRSYGEDVKDTDGIAKFVEIINRGLVPTLTIYKTDQYYSSKDRIIPPLKIWGGWSSPNLSDAFAQSLELERMPKIEGIERVVSIYRVCKGNAKLKGSVELGDIPLCTSAASAFEGCARLESVKLGDMPECVTFDDCFRGCVSLVSASVGSLKKATNIGGMFRGCERLSMVTFSEIASSPSSDYIFFKCGALETVNGELSINVGSNSFNGCNSLRDIRLKGIGVDVNLQWCTNLSLESIRYLVDNAQAVTGKTIYLNSALLEEHEDELTEIGEAATQKGWTINYR